MNIAFVSIGNPRDATYWSGIPYWTVQHLQRAGHRVEIIGPLNRRVRWVYLVHKLISKLIRIPFHADRGPLVLRSYTRQISRKLKDLKFDIIFSDSSIPITYLQSPVPIIFWTDAVFSGGTVPQNKFFFVRFLSDWLNQIGERQESIAISRAFTAIYASHWAIREVTTRYKVSHDHVFLRTFGPGIPDELIDVDVQTLAESRPQNICRLVFVGVDWQRKGGPLTIAIAESLRRSGIETELIIIGPKRDIGRHENVKFIGFLDKNNPSDLNKLVKELSSAHFLILPSRSEPMGIVLVEASALGVPCLAADVEGISTVVENGVNGYVLSPLSSALDYSMLIASLFKNRNRYFDLVKSARQDFERRLSWDSVIKDLENVMHKAIALSRKTS